MSLPPQDKPTVKTLGSKPFPNLVTFLSIVGTLVGILIVFWPRVTVESEKSSIDPLNPYAIPFVITNTGFLPLTNVQPAVGVCESGEPQALEDLCKGSLQKRLAFKGWFIKKMRMDDKYTMRLDDGLKFEKFGGANISIVITYQPWFLWFSMEKEFRFFTRLEEDGTISWINRPIDK